MNTSFTPGSWTFTDEGGGSFYIRDSKKHQLIWLGNSTRFESGENKANARLIAAAPQLLESLQACLFFVPIGVAARHMADHAINLATGQP